MKNRYFYISIFFSILSYTSFAQDTSVFLPEFYINAIRECSIQSIQGLHPQNFSNPQSDIGLMLRSMPNTSGIRRGGSSIDPVYRGFRNNQLFITTNTGLHIEGGCPNRMDPTTSHIDAEEISLIYWETGSNMLLYSQAIGGVLIMKTIEPEPRKKFGINAKIKSGYESNFNGFSNSIAINGGNKNFFFTLMGGNKSFGNYSDGRDSMVKSSFQKDFVAAKIGTAIRPNQHLILNYTRSESRDVLFPALPMDENFDFTDIFNLSYIRYDSAKNEKFRINAYHVRVNHKMDNFERAQASQVVPPSTSIMRAESAVEALTSGVNLRKKFSFRRINGTIGGDFHQIDKEGTRTRKMIMSMNGITTTTSKQDNIWKDAVIRNLGFYGQISYPIKHIHSFITATLRYDKHQHFSKDTFSLVKNEVVYFSKNTHNNHLVSYGLKYDYKPNSEFLISLDAVSAQRSPNMNELYIKRMLVGFDNYDYLGNPNLKPETNNQLTMSFRVTNKLGIAGVNLFASQVLNYIGGAVLPPNILGVATQGALGVKQFSNLGTAIFYGGELVLNSSPVNKLEIGVTAGYTYAVMEKATKYNVANNQVISTTILKNDPLPEVPALNSSVSIIYKFGSLNFIPRLAIEYTLPQNQISEANYEKSTPDYMLINGSIQYVFKKWATINVGVNNILNQAYYNHLNRRAVSSNPLEKIKLYEPGRVFFVNLKLDF